MISNQERDYFTISTNENFKRMKKNQCVMSEKLFRKQIDYLFLYFFVWWQEQKWFYYTYKTQIHVNTHI